MSQPYTPPTIDDLRRERRADDFADSLERAKGMGVVAIKRGDDPVAFDKAIACLDAARAELLRAREGC